MRLIIAALLSLAFAGTLYAQKDAPAPPSTQAPQAPASTQTPSSIQTTQAVASPSSSPLVVSDVGAVNAPSDEGGIKKREAYIYREEGRRDPFLSIITAAKQVEEVRKKGATPLEDYDLTQITLRGIISTAKGYFALFGLPDGKHYTVKENAPMGIHDGKVVKITSSKVIVRQYLRDFKGRLVKEDYPFRLREEE